jgi:hypothetical protein
MTTWSLSIVLVLSTFGTDEPHFESSQIGSLATATHTNYTLVSSCTLILYTTQRQEVRFHDGERDNILRTFIYKFQRPSTASAILLRCRNMHLYARLQLQRVSPLTAFTSKVRRETTYDRGRSISSWCRRPLHCIQQQMTPMQCRDTDSLCLRRSCRHSNQRIH